MALYGLWLWLIWGIGSGVTAVAASVIRWSLRSRHLGCKEVVHAESAAPEDDIFALHLYSLTFIARGVEERYRSANGTLLKSMNHDLGLLLLSISMTAVGISYAQLPSGDAAALVFATLAAVAGVPLLCLPDHWRPPWVTQTAVVGVATCWVVWAAVVGSLGAALPLLFFTFASTVIVHTGILPAVPSFALILTWLTLLLAIWGGREGFCADGVCLGSQLSPTSLLLGLEVGAVALVAAYHTERSRRVAFCTGSRSGSLSQALVEIASSGHGAIPPAPPPPPHFLRTVGSIKVHPGAPELPVEAALQVPISVDSTSEVSGPPDRPPLTDTSSSVYHLPSAADKGSLAAGVLPPGEGRRPSLCLQHLDVDSASSVSFITTTLVTRPEEEADPTSDSAAQLPFLGASRAGGDEPLNSLQRAAQRRALAPPGTLLPLDAPPLALVDDAGSPFTATAGSPSGAYPRTWVLPGVGATQLGLSHRRGTVLILQLRMATADGALQEFEEVDRMVCQIAMSQAEASHGVVHLFGGGAVTISWNAFRPHPEHEIQACHCALAIQQQMAALYEWAQGRLEACHMAIHSGPLVCGIGGTATRKTQVLFGATVQLAQRLVVLTEALEAPILLTQTVYEAVQGTHGCLIADYVKPAESVERLAVYELCAAAPLCHPIYDTYRRAFLDFSGHRYPDCVEKLLTCAADPDGLPVLRRQALRLLAVASAKVASPALFYRAGPYCRTDGWQRDPEPAALPPDLLRRLAEKGFQPSPRRRAPSELDSSARKSALEVMDRSATTLCEPVSPKSEREGPAPGASLAFGTADVMFTDTTNRQWHCSTTLLGAGAFGDVYLAMSEAGMPVAVKRVKLGSNVAANLPQEIKLLSKYRHANIVAYLGSGLVQSTIPQVLIVMEYVACGSLESLLKKFGKFQESSVQRYTRDIVRGLSYLHNNGVLHRDVKPANVLVEHTGACKLADFGTAAMLQHNESHGADLVGTPQYMAPEVLEGDVSSAGDIWAVGVTCLQLLTGKGLLDILTMPGDPRWTIGQTHAFSRTAATVVEILTAQTDGAAAQYLFALSLMEESPDLPTAIQGD
eukprot:EG_transcript_1474